MGHRVRLTPPRAVGLHLNFNLNRLSVRSTTHINHPGQLPCLTVLGHLLLTAGAVAQKLRLARGYRLVINHGPDARESVPHLHVHLLAGRQLAWPPG